MPVAPQQQHVRRSVVPAGVFGDPVQRLLQQREPVVARKADMDGRSVCLPRCTDRLANLRRVAQHEVCGDRGDAIRTPERGFEVDPFVVAEPVPEFPHDGDVRPAEPVDRLPVVPDRKQLRPRSAVEQCFQQTCPGRRDVLELVDQDVAERAPVAAGLHMLRCPVDHVVEVDLSRLGQRRQVAFEDWPEHREKCRRPPLVVEGTGPLGDLLQGKPAALEVLQEGRQDADERVDPSPVFEDREHPLPRQRRQLHAVRRQLLLKVPD